MTIKKTLLPENELKPLFKDPLQLGFGQTYTDYMFTLEYDSEKGWHNAEIKPYQPLKLDPAAKVLHYGQEIFEGQKAYKSPSGEILTFRPRENAKRFLNSLKRMCMAELDPDDFLYYENELLKIEERWIPTVKGTSLYIRPTAIATEAGLGVKAATKYLFFIILSPVGAYFKEGFNPIGLWVSD
ncbi:MAG: branched chain amino acid aminotransferase, partial [Candidatus Aminicenantes bacterium]|nr:branched chain amino acid aminotransferase [Candidatus Aminicenantes bacterium]